MKLWSEGFKQPRGEKGSMEFSKNTGLALIATMLYSRCCQMGRRVFMKFLLEGKLCSWVDLQTCRALQRRPFPSFSVATCSAAYKNNSYLQSSKALLARSRTSFLSVHVLPSPNLYISTSFRFVFALSPPCFSLHFPECCHSAGLVKHAALYSRPGPPCTHPTPRPSPQLNFYSSFI